MEKQTITLTNGTSLAFLERPGGDTPLVLLHGITDNSRTYEPLMGLISADCHVYAVDLRGHGDSSKPDALYNTEAYADDIRCFIREKASAPALLAGHSLGGMVTCHVAATSPELVQRVFLEDPPLYFVGNLNATYEALFNGMVMISTTLRDGSRSRADWFEVMANAPDPYSGRPGLETMGEAKINMRLESLKNMIPKALQDAIDGSLVCDIDAQLQEISSPLVMMTGNPALGGVVTTDEAERVKRLVPGCRVINLPDVGHLIHDQKPGEWLQAINDWSAE